MGKTKIQINNTLIDYGARKKLGLTINEYCVADFIYKSAADPSNNVAGWGFINGEKVGQIASALGLNRSTAYRALQKLKAKKVIEFHPENKTLIRATSLWTSCTIGQLSQFATVVAKEKESNKEKENINIYSFSSLRSEKEEAGKPPLLSGKCQNPEGHKSCVENLQYIDSTFSKKLLTNGKNFKYQEKLYKAGATDDDVLRVIKKLAGDKFYITQGWDMETVYTKYVNGAK